MKKLIALNNIESMEGLIEGLFGRYVGWTQQDSGCIQEYVEYVLGCEGPEILLPMCDILDNEQLQALKIKCNKESVEYDDSFRKYFNRDNILCAYIIKDTTISLKEILDILDGLSEDFRVKALVCDTSENKLMSAVKKGIKTKVDPLVEEINEFNSTKNDVVDEFKLGKLRSDRQTKLLQSLYENKLKVKELAAYNDNYRQSNVTQVIQDFNDFNSTVFRELYATQGETELQLSNLQKEQHLNYLESQIRGRGLLQDSNGREMDWSRFDLNESSQILFSKDSVLNHYNELVDYCELILSKTNDSTPPTSGRDFTTHVMKRRFGQLRLAMLDIKGGKTVICYAKLIGGNEHSTYRDNIKKQAEKVFRQLHSLQDELELSSSGDSTPTPTVKSVGNNAGANKKKRKNKVGKGAERSRPQELRNQGNISERDSAASSPAVDLSNDTLLENAKKITLNELNEEAAVGENLDPSIHGTNTIKANYAKSVFAPPKVLYAFKQS